MMCRPGGPGAEGAAGGGRDAVAGVGRGGRHWRPHPHIAAGGCANAAAWLCPQPSTLSLGLRRISLSLRVCIWARNLHSSSPQHCVCTGGILLAVCVTECASSSKCCSGRPCSHHLHTASRPHDVMIVLLAELSASCNPLWSLSALSRPGRRTAQGRCRVGSRCWARRSRSSVPRAASWRRCWSGGHRRRWPLHAQVQMMWLYRCTKMHTIAVSYRRI